MMTARMRHRLPEGPGGAAEAFHLRVRILQVPARRPGATRLNHSVHKPEGMLAAGAAAAAAEAEAGSGGNRSARAAPAAAAVPESGGGPPLSALVAARRLCGARRARARSRRGWWRGQDRAGTPGCAARAHCRNRNDTAQYTNTRTYTAIHKYSDVSRRVLP